MGVMPDLGQVFTNAIVANHMVSLFSLPKEASILDPCYGTGSFLEALRNNGFKNVTACEIDSDLHKAALPLYSKFSLINCDFLSYSPSSKYDGIIMNPPYIRQEKIDDLNEYGITKKALRNNPIFNGLPSTANMYMYFIIKAIDLLKDNGQLIVIFPSSWMKAKIGENFQNILLSKCGFEKQIHIYGDVFEKSALVEVVILKLVKNNCDLNVVEEFFESKNDAISKISMERRDVFEDFPCRFKDIATIRRGLSTGCNQMFVNPDSTYNISKYTKEIISSPKSIPGYTTQNATIDSLFLPPDDLSTQEVKDYIHHWEEKIKKNKSPKALYNQIVKGQKWYRLREIDSKGILFSYFVRNDMKFVINDDGILARDNFYIIYPKIDTILMFALLNNYYTYYQLELNGKRYGAGLLKIQRYDFEKITFPDYNSFSSEDLKTLFELSNALKNGNCNCTAIIKDITKVISRYCNISFDSIENMYLTTKNKRLEIN